MPSTRRSITTSRRSSSQKNSDASSKVPNPTCKNSKSDKLKSNKSIFPDGLKTATPTDEIMSPVKTRKRNSDLSDISKSIPVKRSKRYSEETQHRPAKQDSVTHVKTKDKVNSSVKKISKTNSEKSTLVSTPKGKHASCKKSIDLMKTKRKSSELSVLESSVSEVTPESSKKKQKEQSSSVDPAISMCTRKRGRPTNEARLAAKMASIVNQTTDVTPSMDQPRKPLDAESNGSSDLKSKDNCVATNSSPDDFSPRRSGRAMVPNRRYQDMEDPADRKTNTPKAKKGSSATKVLQQEQKTSSSNSNKSHIHRIDDVESEFLLTTKDGRTQKICKENMVYVSIPESTTGDNELNKEVDCVVLDKKTTGRVGTFSFCKKETLESSDNKKDNDISVCSLHFKKTSDVISYEKTLTAPDSSEKIEYHSSSSESLVCQTSSHEIVEANDDNCESTVIQSTNKIHKSSCSPVQISGSSSQKIDFSKKLNQSVSKKESDSENSRSLTSVLLDEELEDSKEAKIIDAIKVPSSTGTYSIEKKSQNDVQLNTSVCPDTDVRQTKNRGMNVLDAIAKNDSAVQSHSKVDVKSFSSPRAVTTKKPLIHARGSSVSKPPPEVQTQTIYKVNLDGTSTRTVIILDPDGSSSKGRSLLKVKPFTSKSNTDLQRKEKESSCNNESKGFQSDQDSAGQKADVAVSLVKEVMVESNRAVQEVKNQCKLISSDGDHTFQSTPGKIQKAAIKHNIPDVSNDNLPPFIKVVSVPSKDDVSESCENASDFDIQFIEGNSSEKSDPRVLKMDARTKRAVASILSLESGITFSSPPANQETDKKSSCQESQPTTTAATSMVASSEESTLLPSSEAASEMFSMEYINEESSKTVSSEVSEQSIKTEASNKNCTTSQSADIVEQVDNPESSTSSELTVLWSNILETPGQSTGATDGDENKSKYVTSSTQTPIESSEEKIIIPKVYKSVFDVSHIKKEVEDEYRTDERSKETFVVVKLPEGAVVTQPVVQSRYKYDDTPFLDENYLDIFRCKICCYETKKRGNWYKHKQKHLGLRPHACDKCQYRAATASNLKRHLAIHADIRNYMCQICGMYFRQKIHLERHIKYKHEEKQVRCPLCEYICANENPDLKVHIKRKHFSGELMDSSIKAFTCPECNLVAVSKKDLRQHMKFHKLGPELKLFCEQCSFVTDCDSRLRRHMFIHTKEKPYQCGKCEYRASQKEHVLRHMRNVHDIEIHRRQRKTTSANQLVEGGQISMAALSKLIDRNDYTCRDKIFACNHCSMKFSKLLNLYKHLYTQHENIMPPQKEDEFGCVVCEFQTNTKKNLLVHMRKHNMHDHNPPSHVYSCVLCRYQNPKRRNLFQHMKKKHHIEIVMKEDGTTSCFIEDSSNLPEDLDQNLMTVGDIVTTTTSNFDSDGDETEYRNVISIQNFASMVAPQPTAINDGEGNLVIDTEISCNQDVQTSSIDAAEAIEGLQALSQQTRFSGVVEIVETEEHTVTVMDEPIAVKTEDSMDELESFQEEKQSIQLSAEQLVNLSSGDYVEINGEVYKVEIADGKHGIAADNIELEEVSCVD